MKHLSWFYDLFYMNYFYSYFLALILSLINEILWFKINVLLVIFIYLINLNWDQVCLLFLLECVEDRPISIYAKGKTEPTMKWRPPSLSELNLVIFNMELTHLGSKASKYKLKLCQLAIQPSINLCSCSLRSTYFEIFYSI